ncbi:MAG: TRAP transporter substrate-binding protein DctP [Oscillospiraceae bacterium]|nr:TRAP transporter substrate-binding protein DctP [Oscillospiraceae bacterium]
MKKTLCIVLALVMMFALLAACGGGGNTAATPPPAAAPTQTIAPATPPPPPPQAEGWDFSDATKVNLQFAVWLPDFDPTVIYTANFLDAIKSYTEGTVDYTMHASATLCAAEEQLDAVKSGLADIAFTNVAYYAGTLPVSYLLEYPGVNYAHDLARANAINEWHKTLDLAELKDYKILFASGQGNGAFHTTVPLRTVEDFKGVQMRTSAALIPVMELYGMIPTAMTMGEVYEAMRTGVVQGATAMVMAAHTFKLFEIADYCTMDPYFLSTYVMPLNMDVWNSLTPDQQEAVEAASEYAFSKYIAPGREDEMAGCISDFEAAGVEVIYFDQANLAKMAELNSPLAVNHAAGIPGGNEALALIHELAAKWNGIYPQYVADR